MCKTLKILAQNGSELKLTFFEHPKAVSKEAIMELYTDGENEGLFKFVEDWKSHITENHNQVYLVCGSYYFIGEVQSFLRTSS
jgi:folylpolyglutamate synthase/dihydropteroate synthase